MRDPDDEDDQLVIGYRVDNPKSADADAVAIALPGKLLAPDGPRFMRQRENARNDALSVFLFVNGLNLLGRGRLDQDPITCHAA